jgi:hypothetical protein
MPWLTWLATVGYRNVKTGPPTQRYSYSRGREGHSLSPPSPVVAVLDAITVSQRAIHDPQSSRVARVAKWSTRVRSSL